MGRGRKPNHRGGHRQFTDVETLKRDAADLKRQKYRQQQEGSDSEEEDQQPQTQGKVVNRQGAVGDLPPSESSEEESDDAEETTKVQTKAPPTNTSQVKNKKIKDLTLESLEIDDPRRGLNRKEKEELARQEARKRYLDQTAAGKTDEGRANLARLAIIRQQREDAAKKRAAEQAAKDAEAKARAAAKAEAQGRRL